MQIKHPILIASLCAFIAITVSVQLIHERSIENTRIKIETANANCADTIQRLNSARTHQELAEIITTPEIANCRTPEGNTPLYTMVQLDTSIRRDAIRLLLKYHPDLDSQQANVSQRSDLRETPTPLLLATRHNSKTIVGLLLKAGANPNTTNQNGESALFASHDGSTTAALLLYNGADPNLKAFDLRTPLHAAAYKGEAEIIELLLEAGADVSSQDMYGITPLAVAVIEGRYRATSESKAANAVLNLLKAGADPHKELTQEGQDILMQLASQHLPLWNFITLEENKNSETKPSIP